MSHGGAAAAMSSPAPSDVAEAESLIRSLIVGLVGDTHGGAVTLARALRWVRARAPRGQGHALVRRHRALIRRIAMEETNGALITDKYSEHSGTDTEDDDEMGEAMASSSSAATAAAAAPSAFPQAVASSSSSYSSFTSPVPVRPVRGASASSAVGGASPSGSGRSGSARRPCRAASVGWGCQWCSMPNTIRDSVCSTCGQDKLATGLSPAVLAHMRSHKRRIRMEQAQEAAEQAAQAEAAANEALLADPLPLPSLDWATVVTEDFNLPSSFRPDTARPNPRSAASSGASRGVSAPVSPWHCDLCQQWILRGFTFYHCITCEAMAIPRYSYDLCDDCWRSGQGGGGAAHTAPHDLHDPETHVMRPREALFALGERDMEEEEARTRPHQEEKSERMQAPAAAAAAAAAVGHHTPPPHMPRPRGRPHKTHLHARASPPPSAAAAAAASRSLSVASIVSAASSSSSSLSPPSASPPSGSGQRKRARDAVVPPGSNAPAGASAASSTPAQPVLADSVARERPAPSQPHSTSGKRVKFETTPGDAPAASAAAPESVRMMLLQQRYRQHMAEAASTPQVQSPASAPPAHAPARSSSFRSTTSMHDEDDESIVDMTIGSMTPGGAAASALVKIEPAGHSDGPAPAAAAGASSSSSSAPLVNDEVCHYCHDGGDLLLCDSCVHAYHLTPCLKNNVIAPALYEAVSSLPESAAFACTIAGLQCTPRANPLTMQDVMHEDEEEQEDDYAAEDATTGTAKVAGTAAGGGTSAKRKKRHRVLVHFSSSSSEDDEVYHSYPPARGVTPASQRPSRLAALRARDQTPVPARTASINTVRSTPSLVKLEPVESAATTASAAPAPLPATIVKETTSSAAQAAAAAAAAAAVPAAPVVVPAMPTAPSAPAASAPQSGLAGAPSNSLAHSRLSPTTKLQLIQQLTSLTQSMSRAVSAEASLFDSPPFDASIIPPVWPLAAVVLSPAAPGSRTFQAQPATPAASSASTMSKAPRAAAATTAATASPSAVATPASVGSSCVAAAPSASSSSPSLSGSGSRPAFQGLWKCHSCTLNNPSSRWRCVACSTVRLIGPGWECNVCTLVNSGSATRCSLCESGREENDAGRDEESVTGVPQPHAASGLGAEGYDGTMEDGEGEPESHAASAAAAAQSSPAMAAAAVSGVAHPASTSAAAAASGAAAASSIEPDVLLLISMGFSRVSCEAALRSNGNSRERALEYLLAQTSPDHKENRGASGAAAAGASGSPSSGSDAAATAALRSRIHQLETQLSELQKQAAARQAEAQRLLEQQRSEAVQHQRERERLVAARDASIGELQRSLDTVRADLARALAREQQAAQLHQRQLADAQAQRAQTALSLTAANDRVAALTTQLADQATERECTICMDHCRDVLFLPCSHLVACARCAGPASSTRHSVHKCPQCATKIKKRLVVQG